MSFVQRVKLLQELALLDYAKAAKSFPYFIKAAWPVLEPSMKLLSNWHQDLIAEYLMLVASADIKRLIINMPPRYSKSTIVTILWPVWTWLNSPSFRFIFASYAESLSVKHSVDRRTLINSDWFQGGYADRFQLSADNNQKHEFSNTARGSMYSTGMLGAITGRGGDCIVVDDPHDPLRAESDTERQKTIEAFDSKFTTRLDDKENGRIVIVMQRLHEGDLTGHLLEKGGWEHLKLPAEASTKTVVAFPVSGREIVREVGDVLHPEREGKAAIAVIKKALGPYAAAGQYDQEPSPRSGGLWKREYWQFYDRLPRVFDIIITSWDMTFTDAETSDYVAAFAIGRVGARKYFLDAEHGHYGLVASIASVKRLNDRLIKRGLRARQHIVENKANGPGVVDSLKKDIAGLKLVEPKGDKWERAVACEPTLVAGDVFLPSDPASAEWVQALITEAAKFPRGKHDDRVDAASQGIIFLDNRAARMTHALSKM